MRRASPDCGIRTLYQRFKRRIIPPRILGLQDLNVCSDRHLRLHDRNTQQHQQENKYGSSYHGKSGKILIDLIMHSFEIKLDDLSSPEIAELLAEHLRDMYEQSPPGSVHALDLDELKKPGITFWSIWEGDELVG